jgi:topoisomerase-4 subunit B
MTPPAPNCSSSKATAPAARAKQARDRKTQAVLPIRGKILNVASATATRSRQHRNRRPDPGAGLRHPRPLQPEALRYERIIIMTDADVDGAHIATLLMTFFFQEMPGLVKDGHLYLAHAAALPLGARRHDCLCPRRSALHCRTNMNGARR